MSGPQVMPVRCTEHPDVETYLRCSECGTPICPRCLVQTPVGAKCKRCARLRAHPIYDVRPVHLLKAVGASIGAGLAIGAAWGAVQAVVPFVGILAFFIYAGIGYGVAEATGAAANRKRGIPLQAIAVGGSIIAVLMGQAVEFVVLTNGRVPPMSIVFPVGNLFLWVYLVIACFVAVARLR